MAHYKLLHILSITVLLTTVWGCVATNNLVSTNQTYSPPGWVQNPPADDSNYWYGTGSGLGRDLATQRALTEIASRLKVAVQSEVKMVGSKETTNGQTNVNERLEHVDKLFTDKVSIPGYNIQRSEELNGQTYVLVVVNREQFVRQYLRDVEAAVRSVREDLERLRSKQPIEQYIERAKLQQTTYQLLALTDVLAAADNTFAATKAQTYRRQVSDAVSFLNEVKNQLKFYIVADADSRYLVSAIRELFNTEQLPVTSRQGARDTIIKLQSAILSKGRDTIGGYEISIKTQITMRTTNGHIIGNRSLTLYGASANNPEYAARALAEDLKAKIDTEGGIFTFLNQPADSG